MATKSVYGRDIIHRFIEYLRTGDVKIRSMNIGTPLNDASSVNVEFIVTQELLEALCKSK